MVAARPLRWYWWAALIPRGNHSDGYATASTDPIRFSASGFRLLRDLASESPAGRGPSEGEPRSQPFALSLSKGHAI